MNAVLWPESIGLDKWVAGFSENIAILAPAKVGVGSNAFWCLFIKQLCFWPVCCFTARYYLYGWVGGWISWKYIKFSPQLKLWLGPMHFCLWVVIKTNHFAFNNNPVLRPDTTCLYRWLAGFPEIIAISAPNYNWVWAQGIFWCLLIIVNNFAFYEDAVLWPETTCLDGWVGGWLAGFSGYIAISAPN